MIEKIWYVEKCIKELNFNIVFEWHGLFILGIIPIKIWCPNYYIK